MVSRLSKKEGLRTWWGQFAAVEQLVELMGQPLSVIVDDFVTSAPRDSRKRPLAFDEYLVCPRATTCVPACSAVPPFGMWGHMRFGGGHTRFAVWWNLDCGRAKP